MFQTLTSYLNTLLSSQGLRQSSIVMGGNVVAQGMSAIALILISRRLGPDEFGEFAVGFSLVLMLSKINDLGLTFAQQKFVPLRKTQKGKNQILSLSVQYKLIMSVLILLAGIVLVPWLSSWLGFENRTILYLAFGLNVATVAFDQLVAMLQSLFKFPQLVVANMTQSSGKLLGAVALWLAGVSSVAAFYLAYMLAPILPVIFGGKFLPKSVKVNLFENYLPEAKKIATMAKHSAIAFITVGVIENIDVIMVQGYLQEYEAGLYGGVVRIALLFTLFAFSLGTVLNPRVSRYLLKSNMDRYLKKVGLLAVGCLVGYFIIVQLDELLIWLTIGNAYQAAEPVLAVLLAASFMFIATVAMMATFFAFPKSEWYFSVSGLLQLAALVLFNAWLIPEMGLMGAAWARFWSRLVLFIFTGMMLVYVYRKTYYKNGVSQDDIGLNQN